MSGPNTRKGRENMSNETISDGKVVSFNYILTSSAGDTIDSSSGEPLAYLHGGHNIVPGLERQLVGLKVGDKLDATVPPEEGYGMPHPEGRQQVPRAAFPADAPVEPGQQFFSQGDDGEMSPFWILGVSDEVIDIDFNHPLAGETLQFAVEIAEIRDATDEEKAHGHPHGPGGHNH